MPYEKDYATTNVNNIVTNLFGTAVNSTVSWIDMLLLVLVCGLIVSVFIGLLFKTSRILGFG